MSYADITLVSGATTITLPGDMIWTDRRARSKVTQNIEVTLSGALVIEEFQQPGGYPITLAASGNNSTWVLQPVIDALIALADAPLTAPMHLTYNDGTVVTVRFMSKSNAPAVDAQPVFSIFPQDDTTPYSLTLHLVQASA